MNTKTKVILTISVFIALSITAVVFFAIGAAVTGATKMAQMAGLKISTVKLEDNLVSNCVVITGRMITCEVQDYTNPDNTPDRVKVDYTGDSNRVLQSDTIYVSANAKGGKFIQTTIPDFPNLVTVNIRKP